ncbi:NAD(P)-binding protein [Schizopora paradoxa]|uniref:NAD(P)-binding protein n=1 Tax=Schizopora paradoxa TaxID=27342 RepID=A0A0H2RHE6_9AGAM|nr:NAD(P)-binding protein [Schizopora paradoxa]
MSKSLAGKKIVIIGGSSGIGFGVAKAALLDRASEVFIVSSSKSKVDDAVRRLQSIVDSEEETVTTSIGVLNYGIPRGEVVDGSNVEQIKAFFSRIGEIDHLVLTSGGGIDSSTRLPIGEVDLESRRNFFDLKFWGAAAAAQAAQFRGGAAASLTLTTGDTQVKPPEGWTLIASVLGAVDALGRGLAVDLAPVRVNTIAPGVVKTELWDVSGFSKEIQTAIFNEYAEKVPVNHVADADEIAEAYLFVMKCAYVTGQTILVDGGHGLVSSARQRQHWTCGIVRPIRSVV